MTVTFVGSGMAMLVKCSLSLRVETNVRVGIWSTCFLSKCYRWKHCRIIIVVSIVANNVSSYGVVICFLKTFFNNALLEPGGLGPDHPLAIHLVLFLLHK